MTFQLRRASLLVAAHLGERLVDLSLTVTSLSVLLMIEANPGVTQTELGRAFGMKRANLAPLTAALAARALIQRDPTDGRSHGLRLTDAGVGLARRARERIHDTEALVSGCVSRDAQAGLAGLLSALRAAIRPAVADASEASPMR